MPNAPPPVATEAVHEAVQRPVAGSSVAQLSRMVGFDATDRTPIASIDPPPPAIDDRAISASAPPVMLTPYERLPFGASLTSRFVSVTCLAPRTVTAAAVLSLLRRIRKPSRMVGEVTVAGNSTPLSMRG